MTGANALGPWECFQDASYYDMWCVRRVHDRTFGQGFHLVQGDEAAGLRDLLNTRATDEHPTANEVWEARLGDLRDKAENWQNRAERAEQALAERDAEIVRLKALKTPRPQWFYLAGDMSSDKCRFGVHEVIDEDWLWDNRAEGSAVVQIEVAAPLPDIWCAVRFFTNEEKDQRQSDDDYELTEHATEEAARAALGGNDATE